jgi:hypothetical protein
MEPTKSTYHLDNKSTFRLVMTLVYLKLTALNCRVLVSPTGSALENRE